MRISEFTCARKQTADIDFLITSRDGDRKIRQSFRIRSRHPLRKRIAEPVQPILKLTFIKVIPVEKPYAGHISTMSQEFKRSCK